MSMSNSQEVLTSTSGRKRSRVRIVILLLLSVGTMINYLDRTITGIVAPQLSKEIHIDPAMMGIIFSAFAGLMRWRRSPADVFRPLWQQTDLCPVNFLLVAVYPAAKFHPRPKSLLLLRTGLGVSEAPCFPANSRIVSTGSLSMSARGQRQRIQLVNI